MKKLLKKILRTLQSIKLSFKFKRCKNTKRVILLATPTHGNLGDQAIVYTEKNIIKEILSDYSVIEIENDEFLKHRHFLEKKINSNDIIVVDGGGNLGTIWPWEDDKISSIIESFANNKIVIFPQTVFYDESEESAARLEKNKKIYSQAKDLTIILRDEKSYKFFVEKFPNVKSVFCPDIVLSVKYDKQNIERKNILLCFRRDKEKVVTDDSLNKLKMYLNKKSINYSNTSTIVDARVCEKNRNSYLEKKWKEFSSSKLIITDRLHAMIFAYITGTPCIAINNKSKKVEGSFRFIKTCNFVKMVKDTNDIENKIDELLNIGDNIDYGQFVYPKNLLIEVLNNEQHNA